MSPPIYVTQRTSEMVLGLAPRRFREVVRKYGIRHAKLGKLIMARVVDVEAALDRLTASGQPAPAVGAPGEAVRSVAELLGELGRRRAGGA
jgi:hypothetical protein